ncbi:hypothetical protein ZOD2009_11650 [Haladaptatus paucihalophilus DX253]|uniref:Uncharacterized protein n=1 Tax=Haladaptatus paucihalophilus DX253 TaxID=797209 RepID=E7QU50_HALPU|nr:hypothetical protein [Haladaptatus paucihalophilus]EFW92129.1 hypothetical protein ZOD2009_11650 [Haladaptatus paucihalophilus DX253]SHK89476.1 hypothetical protein SAMN05444342_2539 [Haladaptatus paucihalophilus DX253]
MVSIDRLTRILVLALLSAFVFSALFSPPDPFTQIMFAPVLFVASLPVARLASDDRWTLRNHSLFFLVAWLIGVAGQPLIRGLTLDGTAWFLVSVGWLAVAILFSGWFTYLGPATTFFRKEPPKTDTGGT